MDLAAVGAFAVFSGAAWFFWARYSRIARTRTALVVGAVVGFAVFNLTAALRLSLGASMAGSPPDASDLAVLAAINVGGLLGLVTGTVLRQRSDACPR